MKLKSETLALSSIDEKKSRMLDKQLMDRFIARSLRQFWRPQALALQLFATVVSFGVAPLPSAPAHGRGRAP
jgi:hypothetical protein